MTPKREANEIEITIEGEQAERAAKQLIAVLMALGIVSTYKLRRIKRKDGGFGTMVLANIVGGAIGGALAPEVQRLIESVVKFIGNATGHPLTFSARLADHPSK